jgi:hypothetical protein
VRVGRAKPCRVDRCVAYIRNRDRTALGTRPRSRVVDDDSQHPSAQGRPALETVKTAKHRQPRLLDDLLRDCTLLDVHERETKHHLTPPFHEVREDALIAIPKRRHKGVVAGPQPIDLARRRIASHLLIFSPNGRRARG